MAAIELEGVTHTFTLGREQVHALKELTLSIAEGSSVAVVGPSGSGKSTLLHIIGGLLTPEAGRVVVDGVDLAELSDPERSRLRGRLVGFVFQSFHLQAESTVVENVELPLVFAGVAPGERRERALAVLDEVGLTDRRRHLPSQLSGGEMQRVAMARALVSQPRIVLADEPTGNLDRRTGDGVLELLSRIQAERGITVVIVTHDERVAERADRKLVLEEGELVDADA